MQCLSPKIKKRTVFEVLQVFLSVMTFSKVSFIRGFFLKKKVTETFDDLDKHKDQKVIL